MPNNLKRYQTEGHHHFVTFSCYQLLPYLNDDHSRTVLLLLRKLVLGVRQNCKAEELFVT